MRSDWFRRRNWALHNPLKGWTMHGLSIREAQLLVQTASLAERRIMMVWRSGWNNWFSLESEPCAELLREIPSVKDGAPPPPSFQKDEEITTVQLSSSGPKKSLIERESVRCEVQVPAEIVQGPQSFRSLTSDVSMTGLKFQDRLPEWVAGYFTVILGLEHGPIEITCMLVEDQKKDKTRVEVVETDDEESQLPRYQDWVRQMMKKSS